MRQSRMFLPTLKETPSEAEVVSHKLMLRSGMIKKVAAGIYNLLPMGLRVIRKVEAVVREEMTAAGAQEVFMPMVLPSELWKESGRWDEYGRELLRIKDRHDRWFCLGPTHEEAITDMLRGSLRSYRDLPVNLYQIQTKFRDEIRPRFGLMRGREFIMKDAYSFHASEECAEREYRLMYRTYSRIFERCGLDYRAVEAETGPIGGTFSHEFVVLADTGEDKIATCSRCSYAANTERCEIRAPEIKPKGGQAKPMEAVSTPAMKSVEEVSSFLRVAPEELVKTLIYSTEKGPVAALTRGDAEINESKLKRAAGVETLALSDEETVKKATGAPSGFSGPVGLKIPIYADFGVAEMENAVAGANEPDTHLMNVAPQRDFKALYSDLRVVRQGDGCPGCAGSFEIRRGIEAGHIFKLGTKYSEKMGARFLDEKGNSKSMIMGCYGIGIGRTAAAAIEQNHDEGGIVWPVPLAPFLCHIVAVNVRDEETKRASEHLYSKLSDDSIETLYDDRDERAGVKFKDSDLIGIPVRITVSEKTLRQGSVEIKKRSEKEMRLVKIEEAAGKVESLVSSQAG